ncbi:glycosyltransferase family 2 protein [Oerskovia sp. USHLN155]|uniref:glycosyltransferase family 2 protein n=1 Tax=Oerskovia sp. USHLN155 TaxID=3081288 RepID=UPI00301A01B5
MTEPRDGRIADAVYVLPLRWSRADDGDLTAYLTRLSSWIEVVVVDGSPPDVFAEHHARWAGLVTHVAPRPPGDDENGKVVGVLCGLRTTRSSLVVVADDDVRYDRADLVRLVELLGDAELVRPQNVFRPMPWHAVWDTARTLINRALGGDHPGTIGFRRAALPEGYDSHVLFENLELVRTVRAGGGREIRAQDLFVERRPPSTARFIAQRVRQAYDSQAQPARLAVELSLLPATLWAARRPWRLALLACAAVLVAQRGRLRAGGRERFPAAALAFAPVWVVERALCSWAALGCRLTGGIGYAGSRLRTAAHSERWIRRHRPPGTPTTRSVGASRARPAPLSRETSRR